MPNDEHIGNEVSVKGAIKTGCCLDCWLEPTVVAVLALLTAHNVPIGQALDFGSWQVAAEFSGAIDECEAIMIVNDPFILYIFIVAPGSSSTKTPEDWTARMAA